MRVLVVGAHGQLGAAVIDRMSADHDVRALSRGDLDITRSDAVASAVDAASPEVVVNCAAYNDVDGAEDDPVTAFAVNALGVRRLAQAAERLGAVFIHFGTDFVFDGTGATPYRETDAARPQSVYAMSKLVGEWFARTAGRHYVLRVESLFGGGGRTSPSGRPYGSSLDRLADAMLAGREVRAFSDRVVSPSYVVDVAEAVARLVTLAPPVGLYHCVGSGRATWVDVARTLADALECAPEITAVRMADLTLKAARPLYCALANDKLVAAGVPMPTWQDAVGRYAQRRRALATAGV